MKPHRIIPSRGGSEGSAIIAVLSVTALLSLLLVSLLHCVKTERSTSAAFSAMEQARLSAESGAAAASELLVLAARGNPPFLVGLEHPMEEGVAPCLLLGRTNLSDPAQILPLISHDLKTTATFPKFDAQTLEKILARRLSSNPTVAVDLNDPRLLSLPFPDNASMQGGVIATEGRYPALWQTLCDTEGRNVGRYAFLLMDESARLNPLLHRGWKRDDPVDWDRGSGDLPLTNTASTLLTCEQAAALPNIAETMPTEGSFEMAFGETADFERIHHLLTREACRLPDLIPAGLPEEGLPKYNLNDLATNPAWGTDSYARAKNIARIIQRNLPSFRKRDPSAAAIGDDPGPYLERLACSIVDYISPEAGPTGPPGGEPSGRERVPYVTQIAERCIRTGMTSNSVTIQSCFFAEIWNPYTTPIPVGGIPGLRIGNRARLEFGTALVTPFADYNGTGQPLPQLGPNEFTVVAFAPTEQTWVSPDPTGRPPRWTNGPAGNADGLHHQWFEFFWNGRLVDLSRRGDVSPGNAYGGLGHLGQTLQDSSPRWQCMTVPTWAASDEARDLAEESDEAVQPGSYRFVGDPRAAFLTAYKWCVATNYVSKTLWKGISPAGVMGRGFVIDPMNTWTRRDSVPRNPASGLPPSSLDQTPDKIPSPYRVGSDDDCAPCVIRKGPMLSLGELGHVFDPAQVDDRGESPLAGSPRSRFCCGGGRTLRIGQPEFDYGSPSADWDLPGKRAIDLLDLFTVSEPGRLPAQGSEGTSAGAPGRINLNTAPSPVLNALLSGIHVTSDRRVTNSVLSTSAVETLSRLIEEHRPFSRLSELNILTPLLANADSYTPPLGHNVAGSSPPVADVFDRAREEAFGKIVGHIAFQSRTFRLFVLGESLDRSGKTSARTMMECVLRLTPDPSGRLRASLHAIRWH
jgi:hypothetical protein